MRALRRHGQEGDPAVENLNSPKRMCVKSVPCGARRLFRFPISPSGRAYRAQLCTSTSNEVDSDTKPDMFDSLFRKHLQPSLASQAPSTPDAVSRLTPKELLAAHVSLLNEVEELAGVPREFYRRYYETALHNYANFVQQLPASENHHHATLGGILQHGLEVSVNALKLRRAYLLPPGATPEMVIQKQDLWTYAIFSAALCHDLSKPAVDQTVALFDAEGKESQWVPWKGPMPESIKSYRTKFRRDRVHRLHEKASLLLVGHILPKEGIAWLSDDLSAFSQ